MSGSNSSLPTSLQAKHVIIGAGPAGICAVAELLARIVDPTSLIWIDPQFQVGEFGTSLSKGTSVPGNTPVKTYQTVNNAIYDLHPQARVSNDEEKKFVIQQLPSAFTCTLQVASEPLQHISDYLRTKVTCISGTADTIKENINGLCIQVTTNDSENKNIYADNIILAIGAEAKSLPTRMQKINPNVVFIQSELKNFLEKNLGIEKILVVGSSHSAALATMHILKAGIKVTQLMNKEYLFANTYVDTNGITRIQYDNSGLKGEVAGFTQQLLADKKSNQGYAKSWQVVMHKSIDEIELADCQHAVLCIGYQPKQSLTINNRRLEDFKYDVKTGQLLQPDSNKIHGLFGFGIAYPLETIAATGEKEFSVGIGKFWNALQSGLANRWVESASEHKTSRLHHSKLFLPIKNDGYGRERNQGHQLRSKL